MKHSRGIKQTINTLLSITILTILIFQLLFSVFLFKMIQAEKDRYIEETTKQTLTILSEKISSAQSVQKFLSNNNGVQEYLQTTNKEYKKNLQLQIASTFLTIKALSTCPVNFSLFDNSSNLSFNTYEYNSQISDSIMTIYKNYLKNGEKITFFASGNLFSEVYLCCFDSIVIPSKTDIKFDNLGTSLVIYKLNSTELSMIVNNGENLQLELLYNKNPPTQISITPKISEKKKSIVFSRSIPDTQWSIKGYMNYDISSSILFYIFIFLITQTIIILLLMLVMQIILKNKITNPIKTIVNFLENYRVTLKDNKLTLKNNTEIDIIANSINTMIDKNSELTHKIVLTQQKMYEKELGEKNAILYALQSQINPHFLFNTFDCISSIAYVAQVPKIVEIVVALSKIMRYSIKGDSKVCISEEFDSLENYLTILKIRQSENFLVNINVDDSVQHCKMAKMLLQPLVENSFKHGFTAKKHFTISLKCFKDENNVKIIISDNGKGIKLKKYNEIIENLNNSETNIDNTKIGLVNINSRIKLNYGTQYGLNLFSKEGKYTTVIINFPIEY